MGRYCSSCQDYKSPSSFSSNQWRKGDGYSRCKDCVHGYAHQVVYQCPHTGCGLTFADQNQLKMHSQTHRPRNVACPVCKEVRFRSGANAVQHVESGYCRGCTGRDNARQQIYEYASSQQAMRQYMTSVPMLTNGNNYNHVPDYPYQCQECSKSFRQLSQLLQHNDSRHSYGNNMLMY